MGALDRFGGPESWDLHCQRRDVEYSREIRDSTCMECWHSVACDMEGHEEVGYCRHFGEWFLDGQTPSDVDCEEYDAR